MISPFVSANRLVWRRTGITPGERAIPEETAVSFTYNGGAYAVMMATPQDLEDFAFGFSVTEGVVTAADEISQLDIIEEEIGVELRMWLAEPRAQALTDRRRHIAGPTGCGLCGIESLTEAVRPAHHVPEGRRIAPAEIMQALEALTPRQELNRQTRAVHAAAFWQHGTGFVAIREDVGRHNALDKLGGAIVRGNIPGQSGMVLLTSRVSVEMVQKTAALGVPVLVAVSAPTALAVRTAEAAGITLAAIARDDGFEIFTHPHRIAEDAPAHVA
ncbi:MAG TPA: formate dehydrogenase accessory sulfurtransferase FdhD [Xanthobacteraceae bacterium]|nr:formate dehydrogenase accessory sulfurtransferase FdhD [Xanthobacteraceae bacterium]